MASSTCSPSSTSGCCETERPGVWLGKPACRNQTEPVTRWPLSQNGSISRQYGPFRRVIPVSRRTDLSGGSGSSCPVKVQAGLAGIAENRPCHLSGDECGCHRRGAGVAALGPGGAAQNLDRDLGRPGLMYASIPGYYYTGMIISYSSSCEAGATGSAVTRTGTAMCFRFAQCSRASRRQSWGFIRASTA